jgi:hypothetical protein
MLSPRRSSLELSQIMPDELPEPDEAEVHQLGILHVVEVGRVGEYRLESAGAGQVE